MAQTKCSPNSRTECPASTSAHKATCHAPAGVSPGETDASRRKFVLSTLAGGAAVAISVRRGEASADGATGKSVPKPLLGKIRDYVATQAAVTAPPPFAVMILNRMGFGPHGSDVDDFNALGATDDERLAAYVNKQLDWQSIDDSALALRLGDPAYAYLWESFDEAWQNHHVDGNDRYGPIDTMERTVFVRAVYSKRQLMEFLADFWHNHFNIYGRDTYARETWVSWDRDVLRPPRPDNPRPAGLENGHFLGNFRQMLELTAKHPAMLYYLDNYVNGRADPNENYAREIIELHTLGAINYAGPDPQPGDINTISMPEFPGVAINDKYSDADVYEAMRFLTGWNVEDGRDPWGDPNTGYWHFVEDWHDQGQKQLLGVQWAAFSGVQEIYDMLDLLAFHPGTAKHIALKLCQRFISDEPPQSLVDQVATVFYDNRHQPDQLERVYRFLLNTPEFKDVSTWGSKLKRPFEVVVSAMRACDADFTIRPDDNESNYFMSYFSRTGQRPFNWRAPDGYPDKRSFWEGGASLVHTWRVLDWLIDENAGNSDPDLMPITDITLNGLGTHTPNTLANFWLKKVLKWGPNSGEWYGTEIHRILRDFMRERPDDDPSPWPEDYPIDDITDNSWPYYWNERLRGLVKLVLSIPEFMQR